MKFDITKKLWTQIIPKKAEDKKDVLPNIDSHSMVLYERDDCLKFFVVCGFFGGNEGKLSNYVYSYDIKENTSKLVFSS